jgi:hypothetical protein
MVRAIELLRAFQRNHVADVFYHADGVLLAQRIGADGTNVAIGHIMAALTEPDLRAHAGYYIGKMLHIFTFLLQQMQNQTKRRFLSNAGQFRKFIDGSFEQGR